MSFVLKTKSDMKTSYKHLKYTKVDDEGRAVRMSFINNGLKTQRCECTKMWTVFQTAPKKTKVGRAESSCGVCSRLLWGASAERRSAAKKGARKRVRHSQETRFHPCETCTNGCPKNVFNTWIPFASEFWDSHEERDQDAIDTFKNHVLILCNHQHDIADKVVMPWIAHLIQFPEYKSFVINFISKPGGGK